MRVALWRDRYGCVASDRLRRLARFGFGFGQLGIVYDLLGSDLYDRAVLYEGMALGLGLGLGLGCAMRVRR